MTAPLFRAARGALAALALVATLAPAPAAHASEAQISEDSQTFVAERLRDAVLLYDRHFRVAETGQYLDAIRLEGVAQERLSSTAATGMGLISLAIGDAIGAIPDAEAKAAVTLAHLLAADWIGGFRTDRSRSGWFRHWFDARTGAVPDWNNEKFSPIDSAILGAGAAILGNHLAEKAQREGRPEPEAAALARELVMSVDWTTAIRDPNRGSIHLVFFGHDERPSERAATIPFDEYALLPCMAASFEEAQGLHGAATQVWRARFDMPADLPMLDHGDYTLLGKPHGSIPSHFTHQFALHLCGTYARDPAFVAELGELMAADRAWFADKGGPEALWGLGAGSELVLEPEDGAPAQRYGVARLAKNPELTASPAIMAGFMAADLAAGETRVLDDLRTLWDAGLCRYEHEGLGFLWRCSSVAPELRVDRVEAIDFSTWMLGLGVAHPAVGLGFFQRNAF